MNRPWMPLYIAAYLKNTAHLRALESGAYLHLIMAYWVAGGLPNDDRQLATIAKLSDKEWKACRATLAAFFGPDWSSHDRIDAELSKAEDISNKRRSAVKQREIKRTSNDPSNDHTLHTSPNHKEERLDSSKGKESGYSPPKHGAFMARKSLVYFHFGTPEWEAHSADFRGVRGVDPVPDRGGGYWFKMAGEAEAPQRKTA